MIAPMRLIWLAAQLLLFVAAAAITVYFCALPIRHAYPRDLDGHYAQQNPELHAWFDKLANKNGGLCCSFADGIALKDVDVDTYRGADGNSHYKVRVPGGTLPHHPSDEWVNVPDIAVITEPNKFGQAVAWPFESYVNAGPIDIRCFMPGPGV